MDKILKAVGWIGLAWLLNPFIKAGMAAFVLWYWTKEIWNIPPLFWIGFGIFHLWIGIWYWKHEE